MKKSRKLSQRVLCAYYTKGCPSTIDPSIFMEIHGIGITKARQLVKQGFQSVDQLKSCEDLSKHLNAVQLKGIQYVDKLRERIPYQVVSEHESYLYKILHSIDPMAKLTIAGSYRRKKETCGDIDVLLKTPSCSTNEIYKKFIDRLIKDKYICETFSYGQKKFMGVSTDVNDPTKHRRIDIMYTKPKEYPFAILYFTGSKEFNTNMRESLLVQGMSLNEYGITNLQTKKKMKYSCETERDVFQYLQIPYVKPEDR